MMMNFSRFMKIHKYEITLISIIAVAFVIGLLIGIANNSSADTTEDIEKSSVTTVHQTVETSLGTFKVTAYCACSECCGEYSDGYTATMTEATPGRTIAVDPDVIPYGTEVIIDGETYIAEDCGEAIKGKHIDIFCASHELAEKYGVQYKEVKIKSERTITND